MPQLTTLLKAEIVVLFEQNKTISEIARILHLTRKTVNCESEVMVKLEKYYVNGQGFALVMFTSQSTRHQDIVAKHTENPFVSTKTTAVTYAISVKTLQALLTLIFLCVAKTRSQEVSDGIAHLIIDFNLVFTKGYLESVKEDPDRFIILGISLTCIYMALCVLYIYGAYMFNNALLFGFILAELLRLMVVTSFIVIWLLVLKQNTMDIGLLIGASVASGFFLLGMFYLWVCAATLPVLINEMERDRQAATIAKLRQLLDANPRAQAHHLDSMPLTGDLTDPYRKAIFTVSKNKRAKQLLTAGSQAVVPYYR